jgi:hypothetical protein
MSSRQSRVGLLSFRAWRLEIFDEAAGGWTIILHPASGSSMSPQTFMTSHANGLPALLNQARAWALAEDEPALLRASD